MRKDATDADWRPSDAGSQQISGIYFSFGSLGVTPGQTIYGYSIIPADVTASGTGLVNWNNYPTNTPEAGSGVDMMAGGGIFTTHSISGTVFKDPNGTKLQDNGETGTAVAVNAVLIDSTGKVIQVQPVSATNGTYKFTGVPATTVPGFIGDNPYRIVLDRKSTRLNSSHPSISRMPSSA